MLAACSLLVNREPHTYDLTDAGAAEQCNGLDDDADGTSDEDFECVQAEVRTGTNPCGRPGEQHCGPECTWLENGFVLPETLATCDYCADSAEGLAAEVPIAIESVRQARTTGWNLYGDAVTVGIPSPYAVLADAADAHGAAYEPRLIELGYGPLQVTFEVETEALRSDACAPLPCPLGGAWSAVILEEAATSFFGDASTYYYPAVPGLAFEWKLFVYDLGATVQSPQDYIYVSQLSKTGTIAFANDTVPTSNQNGPTGVVVTQAMTIEITSDDPSTTIDDSAAHVIAPGDVTVRCAQAGADPMCGLSFRPGTRYWLGIAADSTGDVRVSHPRIDATASGTCQGM